MKITSKLNKAAKDNRPFWSFEFFPPKTDAGVVNLYDRLERMYRLKPEFIDVTWGAGGSTAGLTMEISSTAQNVYGLETCMHLTCTNMPRDKILEALKDAKANGIQNILALRGDPPRGSIAWEKVDTGFQHAVDLVRFIREKYGDYFCIGVAGYPEGHSECTDKDNDLVYLKEKVDAGADYIVTQLFYDTELFIDWVEKCRKIGIIVPILPGIMPIQSFGGFKRMTTLCKTQVPPEILESLDLVKDDDQAVRDYGVQLAVKMCKRLMEAGINGFHFYTLNLEKSTRLILEGLDFVPINATLKSLPWNPSHSKKREKENVRPIFWKNRGDSYVRRTEDWDEFPNGRWGDSRSPAYGDLDGYGVQIKFTLNEARTLWGYPESVSDVCELFVAYCAGGLRALPWSDSPLSPETEDIRKHLESINRRGYLTINSQPPVNGVPSSHKVYGWGPKNGFVYQKGYLEFFCSKASLDRLITKFESDPFITFYAVNRDASVLYGDKGEGTNAVTWGVFPGKEIVQPTIVELPSFLAWKDEAFALWDEWVNIYETSHANTISLLSSISKNWFLVNMVHNDFTKSSEEIFQIFADINEQR